MAKLSVMYCVNTPTGRGRDFERIMSNPMQAGHALATMPRRASPPPPSLLRRTTAPRCVCSRRDMKSRPSGRCAFVQLNPRYLPHTTVPSLLHIMTETRRRPVCFRFSMKHSPKQVANPLILLLRACMRLLSRASMHHSY